MITKLSTKSCPSFQHRFHRLKTTFHILAHSVVDQNKAVVSVCSLGAPLVPARTPAPAWPSTYMGPLQPYPCSNLFPWGPPDLFTLGQLPINPPPPPRAICLWSIQPDLRQDRDRNRNSHYTLCQTFTLQLVWDRNLYLYFVIVSVSVPVPFPHKARLNKPSNLFTWKSWAVGLQLKGFLVFNSFQQLLKCQEGGVPSHIRPN